MMKMGLLKQKWPIADSVIVACCGTKRGVEEEMDILRVSGLVLKKTSGSCELKDKKN